VPLDPTTRFTSPSSAGGRQTKIARKREKKKAGGQKPSKQEKEKGGKNTIDYSDGKKNARAIGRCRERIENVLFKSPSRKQRGARQIKGFLICG